MVVLYQVPFNIKDWSVALPASIVAVGALIYIFIWALRQLKGMGIIGHADKPEAQEVSSKKLTAEQELQVREMIDSIVWKRNEKGGLHWANNQIIRWMWEEEDKKDRRKMPRS
jgi:hypothetical protein